MLLAYQTPERFCRHILDFFGILGPKYRHNSGIIHRFLSPFYRPPADAPNSQARSTTRSKYGTMSTVVDPRSIISWHLPGRLMRRRASSGWCVGGSALRIFCGDGLPCDGNAVCRAGQPRGGTSDGAIRRPGHVRLPQHSSACACGSQTFSSPPGRALRSSFCAALSASLPAPGAAGWLRASSSGLPSRVLLLRSRSFHSTQTLMRASP